MSRLLKKVVFELSLADALSTAIKGFDMVRSMKRKKSCPSYFLSLFAVEASSDIRERGKCDNHDVVLRSAYGVIRE